MTLFFLLWNSTQFVQSAQPALAECWRGRSFAPCHGLCVELLPTIRAFAERYGQAEQEPLLARVAAGAAFRRELWPILVGEVLVHGAAALAQVEADPETLCCLLGGTPGAEDQPRAESMPIHQALFGTRDLVFGGKFYRPHCAGWNNTEDVARLADYLGTVDPQKWTAADLATHPTLLDTAERAEEVEFARACFPELQQLYDAARLRGHVVVRELL